MIFIHTFLLLVAACLEPAETPPNTVPADREAMLDGNDLEIGPDGVAVTMPRVTRTLLSAGM